MQHVLKRLVLPDRYERLREHLGDDIANLLVKPAAQNVETLRVLADEIQTRREGILVPLSGRTGVGKTTFAMNVTQWLPDAFTPALQYEGDLSVNDLNNAVTEFAKSFPADNEKIIPINIDHRENYPPDDTELAALKRFLRTNTAGVPVIVFWPETDEGTAWELSERYIGIAGPASVDLPVKCLGPSPDTWPEIGKHTLYLANDIENLEELGVDPTDYAPSKFHTLGAFLRQISSDFNRKILALRRELEKPVSVVIVFASESAEPGVLAQITSSTKYGLLDGHALVSVTPESEVGRWWSQRRGLLTRSIVQLNASALCLPPASAASCVRNFSESMQLFDDAGYRRYGSARGVRDLLRSDVGKYIINESMSRFEARGTPADEATAAFQLLGDQGFNLGNDKKLNELMACGVEELLKNKGIEFEKITYEEKLPFCPLIPDTAIFFSDGVQCIEFTWRKGKFLGSGNRSAVAQYILKKLRDYARELGWSIN